MILSFDDLLKYRLYSLVRDKGKNFLQRVKEFRGSEDKRMKTRPLKTRTDVG